MSFKLRLRTAAVMAVISAFMFSIFQGNMNVNADTGTVTENMGNKGADNLQEMKKTYTDDSDYVLKKDIIILFKRLSGQLGGDMYDIGNYAGADDKFINEAVLDLKRSGVIDSVPDTQKSLSDTADETQKNAVDKNYAVLFEDLNEPLKKGEFYYIFAKYIGLEPVNQATGFNDDVSINGYIKPYIKAFEAAGIIESKDKNFNNDEVIKKGELRFILRDAIAGVINADSSKNTDNVKADGLLKGFLIINSKDISVKNLRKNVRVLVNKDAGNGKLTFIDSEISQLYIASGVENLEVRLSNSKLESAKSMGKNIKYSDLGADGSLTPLPDPGEYKPSEIKDNTTKNKPSTKFVTRNSQKPASGSGSNSSSGSGSNSKPGSNGKNPDTPENGNNGNKNNRGNNQAGQGVPQPHNPGTDGNITPQPPLNPQDPKNPHNPKNPQEPKKPDTGADKGKDNDKDKIDEDLKDAVRDFVIMNDKLYADTALRYKQGESVQLPGTALIGLKNTGENNGSLFEIKWLGKSLNDINNSKKGEYEVAACTEQELIINDKNYGKVKFIVKVIIE
ncbi:hypothetical protein [Johnsonella ignava]|uniref:hypothetical protein n=1 Tax=Johnsonella ignava TaxID=43995 RepID=UPI0023F26AD9|nr:hypothetical protein [Johnsonella ignava]